MTEIRKTKHATYDLKYHFVWIPKYRKKILKGKVAKYIRRTFRKIAKEYGWEIEEMSIQKDHVHLFLHAPPKYAPAGVVQIMKSISAREVFEKYPKLREQLWAGEFWSDGYFVRSVGDRVTAELVRAYIRYQEEDCKPQQLRLWD
jgi:putative transposase